MSLNNVSIEVYETAFGVIETLKASRKPGRYYVTANGGKVVGIVTPAELKRAIEAGHQPKVIFRFTQAKDGTINYYNFKLSVLRLIIENSATLQGSYKVMQFDNGRIVIAPANGHYVAGNLVFRFIKTPSMTYYLPTGSEG